MIVEHEHICSTSRAAALIATADLVDRRIDAGWMLVSVLTRKSPQKTTTILLRFARDAG